MAGSAPFNPVLTISVTMRLTLEVIELTVKIVSARWKVNYLL
jgi:hypothetical protein